MEHLKFVFLNSAYLIPFAIGFLLLGFLFGFFHWNRWKKIISNLEAEADELRRHKTGASRLSTSSDSKSQDSSGAFEDSFKFNEISFDD